MFTIKIFIKKGLFGAIGKMADYQIILNATGWFEKGVLNETDLEEIDNAINSQYPSEDVPFQDELVEEIEE